MGRYDMGNGYDYVTQDECEDRRKVITDRIDKEEGTINDLKIVIAEIRTTLAVTATIGKATFGAVASGMVTIVVILLTRGI